LIRIFKFNNNFINLVLNQNSESDIKEDLEKLNIFYTPPELTSSDFYFSEITKFSNILSKSFDNFYRNESMKNKMFSLFICVSVVFFIAIILQHLTFADLSNVLFCSMNKNSIINITSFTISLIYVLLYYAMYFILIFFIQGDFTSDISFYIESIFSNYGVAYYEIIKNFVLPISIYLIYSKIIFWLFLYSQTVSINDRKTKKVLITIDFSFFNMMRNIKGVVLKNGALAYIYLLRIYTLFFTVLLSMIMFFIINRHLYFFSPNNLRVLLVYNTNENHSENLNFYFRLQLVNIVFLLMQLIYFFNYPKFSKTKQIFDSLFILYDMKIINSLNIETTCEKDVLESSFITEFLNFDFQSEIYHYTTNGLEFPNSNLSEVIFIQLNSYYRLFFKILKY